MQYKDKKKMFPASILLSVDRFFKDAQTNL